MLSGVEKQVRPVMLQLVLSTCKTQIKPFPIKQWQILNSPLLLKGQTPRLIDEWQVAPDLWDAVRFEVDQRTERGQFILTGSAVPPENVTAHTGTGRISRIIMRPMSLYESKESTGQISLRALFDGMQEDVGAESELSIEQIAHVLCRGGWPASIHRNGLSGIRMAMDYVEAIINQDVSRVDGNRKKSRKSPIIIAVLSA